MKIESFQTRAVSLPGRAGTPAAVMSNFVALTLRADDGLEGIGYAGFVPRLMLRSLYEAVEALAGISLGEDPLRVEAVSAKLLAVGGAGAPAGMVTRAAAAIDVALWDIRGKAAGQPLWKLLGGARERVPCYASGELWRGDDLKSLAAAAPLLLEQGFRAVKLRLGAERSVAAELERLRIVRQAVGAGIDVMADVNQLWDVNRSILFGRRAEACDLYWLEDPIDHQDYDGLARIADSLDTPLAAGEYHYGIAPFRHMLARGSIDIAMIDLMRAGGLTPWMKIAHTAQAFNIPVVSHLAPEILAHAMAAIPNALYVEHMPWALGLFREGVRLENGEIALGDEPGLGLEFDPEALERYGI